MDKLVHSITLPSYLPFYVISRKFLKPLSLTDLEEISSLKNNFVILVTHSKSDKDNYVLCGFNSRNIKVDTSKDRPTLSMSGTYYTSSAWMSKDEFHGSSWSVIRENKLSTNMISFSSSSIECIISYTLLSLSDLLPVIVVKQGELLLYKKSKVVFSKMYKKDKTLSENLNEMLRYGLEPLSFKVKATVKRNKKQKWIYCKAKKDLCLINASQLDITGSSNYKKALVDKLSLLINKGNDTDSISINSVIKEMLETLENKLKVTIDGWVEKDKVYLIPRINVIEAYEETVKNTGSRSQHKEYTFVHVQGNIGSRLYGHKSSAQSADYVGEYDYDDSMENGGLKYVRESNAETLEAVSKFSSQFHNRRIIVKDYRDDIYRKMATTFFE